MTTQRSTRLGVAATYRVTAAGSAVVGTLFPRAPHEMVTIYTVDKADLVLTHDRAEAIEFKCDGGGNINSDKDRHMHEATFAFKDATHVISTWLYYKDGKPGGAKTFNLVRTSS